MRFFFVRIGFFTIVFTVLLMVLSWLLPSWTSRTVDAMTSWWPIQQDTFTKSSHGLVVTDIWNESEYPNTPTVSHEDSIAGGIEEINTSGDVLIDVPDAVVVDATDQEVASVTSEEVGDVVDAGAISPAQENHPPSDTYKASKTPSPKDGVIDTINNMLDVDGVVVEQNVHTPSLPETPVTPHNESPVVSEPQQQGVLTEEEQQLLRILEQQTQ